MRNTVIAILIAAALAFIGGMFSAKRMIHPETVYVTTHDTTIVTVERLVEVPKIVERRVVDSIPVPVHVPVHDTTEIHDTTYILLPREQVYYEDTLYRAWVSGYEPRLDSLRIFQKEVVVNNYIKETRKPKRFNLSISAGYGMGRDGLTPVIAVTGGYTLLEF